MDAIFASDNISRSTISRLGDIVCFAGCATIAWALFIVPQTCAYVSGGAILKPNLRDRNAYSRQSSVKTPSHDLP